MLTPHFSANNFSLNFSGKEKAKPPKSTKKPVKKQVSATQNAKQPGGQIGLDISATLNTLERFFQPSKEQPIPASGQHHPAKIQQKARNRQTIPSKNSPKNRPAQKSAPQSQTSAHVSTASRPNESSAKPSSESGLLKSVETLSRERVAALKEKISRAGAKLYNVALLPTSNTTKYIGKAALENILLYGATSLVLPEGLILPGRLKDTAPVIVHFNQKIIPLLPFAPAALAKNAFMTPKAASEVDATRNPETSPPDESPAQPSKPGKVTQTVQGLRTKVPGYGWLSEKLDHQGGFSRWLNNQHNASSVSDGIIRPLAAVVNAPHRYLEKHPSPVLPVKPDENASRYRKKKYQEELDAVLKELQAHEKGLKKAKRISAFARGAALCVFLGFNYGWTDGVKTLWKLAPGLYPGQYQVVGTLSDTYNVPFTNLTSGIYRAPSAYIVAPVNPECIFELVDPITKQRFRCVTGGATAQELHRLWTFPILGDNFAISLGDKPLAGGLRSGRVKPPVQDSVLMMVHEGKDILQVWRNWKGDQPGEFWVERNYDTWFKGLPVARITLKTPEELEGHPQEQALLRKLYDYEDGKPVRLNPDAVGAIAAVAGLELDSSFTTHKRDKDIQAPLKGH
jgi:hypothetical protein